MCGRFTLRAPTSVLVRAFQVETVGDSARDVPPRYNIAPTQSVATIREIQSKRDLTMLRWGLVPPWAEDLSIGSRMINARGETVAEKPSFRAAFRKRRCLVLADGYFEWMAVGSKKQPYWIRAEMDLPFAMAGLWESWRSPAGDGETTETCAIITTDANQAIREVHDRMPVILPADAWDLWIDNSVQDVDPLKQLLRPHDSDAWKISQVSTYVNNARHEGKQCVASQPTLF